MILDEHFCLKQYLRIRQKALIFDHFLFLHQKLAKNREKRDFDHHLDWEVLKCWSKYTTIENSNLDEALENSTSKKGYKT